MSALEAVFRDGGRQYTARKGATLDLDYREVEPGDTIEFSEVLYLDRGPEGPPAVGAPLVPGAKVVGRVVGPVKGEKVVVMHFRAKKHSKRRVGHRQKFTRVTIERIEA
jgi:large subunit ribosomal protein L21